MATYLKFHQLEHSPFEGQGSGLVLATESLRHAYAQIKAGLEEGAPRICLSGGPGIGKSSLARALPKLLGNEAHCVLVRDPSIDWTRLEPTIAKQLGLAEGRLSRRALLAAREPGRHIVIVIDQAEHLPSASLEHLDTLLGYRDDAGEQLVKCVLLASLEDAPRGHDVPLLWWLDKLTTRQLTFSPIPEAGIRTYIDKHLKKAGWNGPSLFGDDAVRAIHRYTGGVPGAVSALCEQLLAKAAAMKRHEVTSDLVARLCGDAPPDELELAESSEPLELADPTPRGFDLPRFEPRGTSPRSQPAASTAARRTASPPRMRPGSESGLEIQQGLLPVETSNYSSDNDFFADAPRQSSVDRALEARSARKLSQRLAIEPLPGRTGSTRLMRRLRTLGLLALLAVAVHAWLVNQNMVDSEPFLNAARWAATLAGDTVAPVVAPMDRAIDAVIKAPKPEPEIDPTGGLTADLRLAAPAAAEVAPEAAAAPAPVPVPEAAPTQAAAPAPTPPDLSLPELYDIAERAAEQTRKEGAVFEPWSQQTPEAAAPAARAR